MTVESKPRSRSDRHAIVTQSSLDRGHDQARSQPPPSRNQSYISSRFIRRRGSRIDHDRGSRSQLDSGPIAPRSGLIYYEIEATIVINGSSRSHDRSWPSIRLHDRIKRPQNRAKNSSLKTHVFLLCSSTFDRFVKKLSEFRGRS